MDPIAIYHSERDVPGHFDVVGIVTHNDPGKYQILTLQDAIPKLKEKARSLGANALIIDESRPVKSGIISTGIWVSARAIRVQR